MSRIHPFLRQENFVGRKPELKLALRALENGKHVFVRGPYGIGKTTFARAVVAACGGPRLAISLQESPSEMADEIIRVLSSYKPGPRPERSSASAIYFHDRRTRIQSFRKLKALMERLCVYRFPILVDDFRKITTSKIAFLNMLVSMGFRIILAVDSGYDVKNIESLAKTCPIHLWIDLPRLTREESKELIASLLRGMHSNLVPSEMDFWIQTYKGHPLTLVDRVRHYLRQGA